ncbi:MULTISPECIES: type II toxin-antitoxin system HicA family toxin [Melioribacter]|uniref:type II toxin-antitoxin system HicA family toxin n=1 Tax=Melioribacter TaxID=1134403 RepID=UPI001D04EC0E
MKIPRDISAEKFGYNIKRQKGSHIRLTVDLGGRLHHITIPNHNSIKNRNS